MKTETKEAKILARAKIIIDLMKKRLRKKNIDVVTQVGAVLTAAEELEAMKRPNV